MLLADSAIFGHVASSLPHEPDRSVSRGLGFAGTDESRVGGRHFWAAMEWLG